MTLRGARYLGVRGGPGGQQGGQDLRPAERGPLRCGHGAILAGPGPAGSSIPVGYQAALSTPGVQGIGV
ncbi:MAG: hypothetical protein ACRDRJ_41015 [Streptosporangiaceae bacterium]